MTVAATNPYIRYQYAGPGDYAFTFRIFEESDITAYHTDTDGVVSTLLLGTDYTVTIQGELGGYCTLTYDVPDGWLDIRRILPYTQLTDWVNNNPLDVEVLETDLDRIVMILQQMNVDVEIGTAISNWRGDWQSVYPYVIKDLIRAPSTNLYTCVFDHVSSGDFDADLAAGYWDLVVDVESVYEAQLAAEQAAEDANASALAAQSSENNAANSETQAGISEVNTANDAQDAANCAEAATTAAVDVNDGVIEAYHWAQYPEDSPVPESTNPPEYSAYHWMLKASAIAGGGVVSLSAVPPITLDNTDPNNPIVGVDGIPSGGTTGQHLAKIDGSNYNTEWADPPVVQSRIDTRTGVSGAITLDVANYEVFVLTIIGTTTIAFTGFVNDTHKTVVVVLNGAGTQVTFPGINFPEGTAPEFSVGRDRLVFASEDGGTTVDGGLSGIAYA